MTNKIKNMALHETDGYWAGTGFDDLFDFCFAWLCYPSCDSNDLLWDYNSDNNIDFEDWAYHEPNINDVNIFYGSDNGRYILTDFMGSVIGIAKEDGSTVEINYNAWGVPYYTGGLDGLNILWNGYYSDAETGNYYLRNRYYSPLERRFITEDPRGIVPDGIWNNRFSILDQYADGFGLEVYCQSDPLNSKDIWGLYYFNFPMAKSGTCGIRTNGSDQTFTSTGVAAGGANAVMQARNMKCKSGYKPFCTIKYIAFNGALIGNPVGSIGGYRVSKIEAVCICAKCKGCCSNTKGGGYGTCKKRTSITEGLQVIPTIGWHGNHYYQSQDFCGCITDIPPSIFGPPADENNANYSF